MLTIARNLTFDALRAGRRVTVDSEAVDTANVVPFPGTTAGLASIASPSDEASTDTSTDEQAVNRVDLLAVLNRLPPEEREIVLLKAVAGLAHREIAAMLGVPEGTVRWKYGRALPGRSTRA